ncbi:MAG TPA: hypothetical protein VF037_01795 [Gemmatimonadales bacterium]
MAHIRTSNRPALLRLILTVLPLAACAPLTTYGRSLAIAQKCIAADELRRGGEPSAAPGSPVPVTPADSVARPTSTAAAIRCEGGLTR